MTQAARSPMQGAVSTVYLKLDDVIMKREWFELIDQITVDSSLQLPDVATITLRDPQGVLVDDETLKLGTKLKVVAQVRQNEEVIFDGELVELEPRFVRNTQQLRLRAFDRLHRLSRGTHTRSFLNVSDMDLVKKLAGEAGMTAQTGPSSVVHKYVLQHNQSNLAFLRERVSRLGYVLYADGTTLRCEPLKGQDRIELTWGDTLSEFLPRLSSVSQSSRSTVRSWDPQGKRAVVGQAVKGQGKAQVQERTQSEQVAQGAFNMEAPETASSLIVRDQAYAAAIASAQRNTVSEQLLEAQGTTAGYPKLTAGTTLSIRNVGKRFSGEYVASSVRHLYRTGEGYSTEFTVSGSRPDSLASLIRSAAQGPGAGGAGSGAAGQGTQAQTPAPGLMIGVVTNNNDPENLGRVKVKWPALSDQDESDWARVVGAGGGASRGTQVLPEVNDEVLIGFEHNDIHHPYVIGGLWNGQDAPPYPTAKAVKNGKVIKRVFKTRLGHELVYDDPESPDPPLIRLESSKHHTLVLNDDKNQPHIEIKSKAGHRLLLMDDRKAPQLLIRDKNGNEVLLDSQQNVIRITSKGRLELKAMSGISIDGGAGPVDVKGVMINLN